MLPSSEELPELAGTFVILLVSIALHESAHAFVADRLGDPTPREKGRVTLNPLPHLHPIASVLLPGILIFLGSPFLFGAGRPVPVSLERLRNPSRDFMLVAIAGPLSNLLIALVVTLVFVALRQTGMLDYDRTVYFWLGRAIELNVLLAVLNSLPIPPLDGSRFLAWLLPRSWQPIFYRLDPIGFIILLVLVVAGLLQPVLQQTAVPLMDWWSDVYVEWLI